MQRKVLAAAVLLVLQQGVAAQEGYAGEMVVTAPPMEDPLTVVTDPKEPVQPVPAADGAAYLKNIPGFSTTRKGGTSGDPVFRGLAASRVNILTNDASVLGGCGMRMDPPTAYTYPETFDRVTVLKGPQSVRHGASSAATVLFERDPVRFEQPGVRASASALAGSFERHDEVLDVSTGSSGGSLRGVLTRSEAGDYQDGDGTEVHSSYKRWSATAAANVVLGTHTDLELSMDRSDAEAAYADRMMDGTKFDRTGYGARLVSRNVSERIERLEVTAFHNYVDHVMDNFTLRTLMDPGKASISNPDRETDGVRLAMQLGLGEATFAWVGLDQQSDAHTLRMVSGSTILDGARRPDASFEHVGLFTEIEHELDRSNRVVGGLRVDRETARAEKTTGMPATYGGAVVGTEDEDTNRSGFLRWEHALATSPTTFFVGAGQAERSPDYWERAKVFNLDPERTRQLDLGVSHRGERLRWTVSAFSARHDDYILIGKTPDPKVFTARNIEAETYGGEADLSYSVTRNWRVNGALAYVRGDNRSDDVPLAQIPPLEGIVGLQYAGETYSAGLSLRAVAEQDRVDVGSGSIVGQDIGTTDGFQVLSLNAGYRPNKAVKITAGVDNLLDETYAEHISRGGAMVSGFEQTTRVNEPGRSYWLKASFKLN